MLDRCTQSCDGVIHLVGDMTGAMTMAPCVAAIAQKHPELASCLPLAEFLQPGGPCLRYTQWEAGWRCFIASPCSLPPPRRAHCSPPTTSRNVPPARGAKPGAGAAQVARFTNSHYSCHPSLQHMQPKPPELNHLLMDGADASKEITARALMAVVHLEKGSAHVQL
jgi:hypothetical protein